MFSGTVLSAIDILITMASYPIYLKYLDAEMYGLWTIVSVVLTYSQLGQLRIGAALIKYAADNYWKKISVLLRNIQQRLLYLNAYFADICLCVVFFKWTDCRSFGSKKNPSGVKENNLSFTWASSPC